MVHGGRIRDSIGEQIPLDLEAANLGKAQAVRMWFWLVFGRLFFWFLVPRSLNFRGVAL